MIKLRARVSAIIVAAILTMGSAFGITVATAAPAQAFTCAYEGFIFSPVSAAFLDDYGGGSQTFVHTYPYTGSNNQDWCLEAASQGGYYLHPYNNLGLCLDVPFSNYANGQRIWVYTCNGTLAQRWCWNGDGYIVTGGNSLYALHDNGEYRTVTIQHGGNEIWGFNTTINNTC
jgi:hypothetical protein